MCADEIVDAYTEQSIERMERDAKRLIANGNITEGCLLLATAQHELGVYLGLESNISPMAGVEYHARHINVFK